MDDLSASSQAQDWGAGVRVRIHLARQAVQFAHEKVDSEDVTFFNKNKLGIAHAYFQPPFSKKRSAKAHNLVMDVRNFAKKCSPQCEVLSKNAALANRDALVLQICCSVDSTSYVCFEFAVETAFNIKNIKVFRDTRGGQNGWDSQMHLSCNNIRTFARTEFNCLSSYFVIYLIITRASGRDPRLSSIRISQAWRRRMTNFHW